MLITLPSHMLTLKPPYTILWRLYIVFILKYLNHTFTWGKKNLAEMESDDTYQLLLWSSTPNSHFDMLSSRRRWQQQACVGVCVWFQMSEWPFNVCLCLCLKGGEAFQGTNVDVAGRLRTTYTRAQHHPEPPPPPCGMAIIKMIYLTIGPGLRD